MLIPAAALAEDFVKTVPGLPCGGQRGVLERATELAAQGIDSVCALLIDCSPDARLQRGAIGLFDPTGSGCGTLSTGAVGQQVQAASRQVLKTGKAIRIRVREDEDIDPPPAARDVGQLDILLVLLPAADAPLREAWMAASRDGAWLRLRLDRGDADGTGCGRGEARHGSCVHAFDESGASTPSSIAFAVPVNLEVPPSPRLLLLGLGPESRPLATIARLLGWHVEAVDARPGAEQHLPDSGVDRLHTSDSAALDELLGERAFDAAILGAHDFELDARHLRQLGESGIGFIGLLGSPARRDALFARLDDMLATQLEARVYAPAGLRLGGEGAEATALAIAAQLQYYLAHDLHA